MNIKLNLHKKTNQYLVLFFLAFVWGGSFILIKKGLISFSDYQVGALRIFISFLILLPFSIKNLKKITKRNIKSLIMVGFIGNGIPAILFAIGQTKVSSSLAGILNSTTPIFTLIIGYFFYKIKGNIYNIVGIIIGLIGAFGLISYGNQNIFSGYNIYIFLILLASIFYATNLNEIKAKLNDLDALAITSIAFFFIGPFSGIYLFSSDFFVRLSQPDAYLNLFFISLLAILSSVIAVTIFNILVKYSTALFASSVTYIIPVFAIIWGIIDGESISLLQILFTFVIIIGVYLVNKTSISKYE